MPEASFRIVVPRELSQWELGFGALPDEAAVATAREFSLAMELFYAKTQEFVHVITGFLKSTGHYDVDVDDLDVVAELIYDASYAGYEIDRGGPHDFMALGWEASARTFEDGLGGVFADVVGTWRLL